MMQTLMNNELVASRSVPYWRERINERWQESVQAIIDVGRLLLAAKAALGVVRPAHHPGLGMLGE